MSDPITVHCPSCDTGFPVDPAKVPEGGVRARCSVCQEIFPVEVPGEEEPDFGDSGLAVDEGEAATAGADVAEPDVAEPEPDVGEPGPGLAEPELDEPDVDEAEEAPAAGLELEEEAPATVGEEDEAGEDELELQSDQDFFGGGGPAETAVEEPPAEEEKADEEAPSAPAFGQRTPEQKAKRLARVLVSDMISYNPELHQKALERGTLEEDFEEEIEKSWEEYVEQVGEELADSTNFWTEALNEILAEGEEVF